MLKKAFLVAGLLGVMACSAPVDLEEPRAPLGDFSLGHNIVVAPKVKTTSTVSRVATQDDLTEALRFAIDERFAGYDGPKEYHFGVSVEGYVLAKPGIPVVAAPKSAMIIRVTVWDDAAGKKLNEPPEQMTILEQASGAAIVGTGWSQSADDQLRDLSIAAAKAIETFLLEQMEKEGWFLSDDPAATTPVGDVPLSDSLIDNGFVTPLNDPIPEA
ncbi:MAG: hypothetical protein AAF636_18880 [Pseudomonadota bacterium]